MCGSGSLFVRLEMSHTQFTMTNFRILITKYGQPNATIAQTPGQMIFYFNRYTTIIPVVGRYVMVEPFHLI